MSYPITPSTALIPNPVLEKHGRLAYEYGTNPKQVLAYVADSIHRAGLVMGISIEPEKAVLSSKEAVKKILEVWPQAWIDDICKAIEMASFGEIRLENQLSVISAANIYGWYKEFRVNHPQKSVMPMLPPRKEPEMSKEEKYKLCVDGFTRFLDNPKSDEIGCLVFYDRLVKLGAIDIPNEVKTAKTIAMLRKLIAFPPHEFRFEKHLRNQATSFREFFANHQEGQPIVWAEWSDNEFVQHAIREVKRELVLEAVDFADRETLMAEYLKQISDELSINIS